MKVLVTGCGGFLGTEIVQQLLARGDQVTGLGRREYPHLTQSGMQLKRGDVGIPDDVHRACDNIDAVIHTAAVAGVWGSYEHYFRTNAAGTSNVIAACRAKGIGSLVFCSSPSVTFGGSDQSGVDESEPYPTSYLCHYPRTKAMAEREVLAAHKPGTLATCSLRPHLIWGENDPHLFPRLIERAKIGKLVRVGTGKNLIDTIHVKNAAHAHLLALDRLVAEDEKVGGRAFFLSQGEPVECWEWLSRILQIAKVPVPDKSISYRTAHAIGLTMELAYRATFRKAEPPMTRFLAAQLAKDHYFDITAARDRLGFQPIISTEEGIERLKAAWHKP